MAMLTTTIVQTVLLAIGFFRTKTFAIRLCLTIPSWCYQDIKTNDPFDSGMLIYRAVPLIDRFFLSQLPEGSISHIAYANKLINAISPVIVTGISISIFPLMSKYAAEQKWDELKAIMSKGIKMLIFLSIPFVVILG